MYRNEKQEEMCKNEREKYLGWQYECSNEEITDAQIHDVIIHWRVHGFGSVDCEDNQRISHHTHHKFQQEEANEEDPHTGNLAE